jgi:hypothetical protein
MSGDKRQLCILEIAVDDMKVCAAHCAGFDFDQQFADARPWNFAFSQQQWFSDFMENHCLHFHSHGRFHHECNASSNSAFPRTIIQR